MDAKMYLVNYRDMQATLEITMTIAEWDSLNKQLDRAWPSSRLSSAINNLVSKVEKTIRPDEEIK